MHLSSGRANLIFLQGNPVTPLRQSNKSLIINFSNYTIGNCESIAFSAASSNLITTSSDSKKLTPEQLALLGLHHGFISETVLLAVSTMYLILNQLVKVICSSSYARRNRRSFLTIAKE